jgi:hypothetical protein
MDLHIGDLHSEVTPFAGHAPLSDEDRATIVAEVTQSIDARRASDARREDETQLWNSVRAGTGR